MSDEHECQPENNEHANRGKEPSPTPASLSSCPDCGGTGRVMLLTSSRLCLRCGSTGLIGPSRVVTATDAVLCVSDYDAQGRIRQRMQIDLSPVKPVVFEYSVD